MRTYFGTDSNGEDVYLYTLQSASGIEVAITNYGAAIVSIKVPDRAGRIEDVVLGYDSLGGYLSSKNQYFGATIGRYANRIALGSFSLDSKRYEIPINDGPNALHGGDQGFDKRVWSAEDSVDHSGRQLKFQYLSKHGEEGFPGNLNVEVSFCVTDQSELRIEYTATSDRDTVVSLTNHSYFNLRGEGNGDILQHELALFASRFTPIDETLIPTGELCSVANTPFDFLESRVIGARIQDGSEQIRRAGGYDHNYVLDGKARELTLAARVTEPSSGRVLEVLTTEPGIQFYSGNFLDGSTSGKSGRRYGYRSGFCLETQHFPDSPNHAGFPSTLLKAGPRFQSMTVYRFSTM